VEKVVWEEMAHVQMVYSQLAKITSNQHALITVHHKVCHHSALMEIDQPAPMEMDQHVQMDLHLNHHLEAMEAHQAQEEMEAHQEAMEAHQAQEEMVVLQEDYFKLVEIDHLHALMNQDHHAVTIQRQHALMVVLNLHVQMATNQYAKIHLVQHAMTVLPQKHLKRCKLLAVEIKLAQLVVLQPVVQLSVKSILLLTEDVQQNFAVVLQRKGINSYRCVMPRPHQLYHTIGEESKLPGHLHVIMLTNS
jgi:transcriptional antiterminator Rof (Rho-off)